MAQWHIFCSTNRQKTTYLGGAKMRNSISRFMAHVIVSILGSCVFSCLVLILPACKISTTAPETPPIDKTYHITAVTVDIFDNSPAGGSVTLNGVQKDSGGTFEVENGNIDSISVEVPGFNPNYIFCQSETGETVLTKSKSGLNSSAVAADITLYVKLIPSDFNTSLLSNCIGGDQWDDNPFIYGDGTVQRYEGNNVIVGLQETGEKATHETITNLKRAVSVVNEAAQGVFFLQYLESEYAESGLWYFVDNVSPPIYRLRVTKNDVIFVSGFFMKNNAPYKTVLEGVVRALGIRRSGGSDDYPYLSDHPISPAFINDGERALRLIYLLPPGFRL